MTTKEERPGDDRGAQQGTTNDMTSITDGSGHYRVSAPWAATFARAALRAACDGAARGMQHRADTIRAGRSA